MIKARIYSVTFNTFSKWVILPETLFKCSDSELLSESIKYVIRVSGYKTHLNESLDLCIKA